MYSLLDCGGLHGHVKVAPNDGTVYVPNKSCGGNQAVAVSEDGGTTWSVRKDPASTAGDSDPSVGVGAKGTVYMGYQAADGTPRRRREPRQGQDLDGRPERRREPRRAQHRLPGRRGR